MSASAARSTSTPSTFATLLRRSKFASFDPQIGQVYATHGGYAHRGDYGLKRPLSLRRRDARITVKSVDTRHQQTEWRSAYLDAKFVQKQQETGCPVTLHNAFDSGQTSSWARTLGPSAVGSGPWHVYSEFNMGPSREDGEADEARGREEARLAAETQAMEVMPYLRSMTESQFNSYAKRASRLFPAHQKFSQQFNQNARQTDETSNRTRRLNEGNYVRFLVNEHSRKSSNPSSTSIRPLPHANAGLEYTHAPSTQQYFFTKPLPGRRLYADKGYHNRSNMQVISVGGWSGVEHLKYNESTPVTDFGFANGPLRTDREAGQGLFRIRSQQLVEPPKVVDQKPQSMQDAEISLLVMTHEAWNERRHRPNPHQPGSREYVAYVERAIQDERELLTPQQYMTKVPTYNRRSKDADTPVPGREMLNTLSHMLKNKKSEGRKSDDEL